MVKQIDAEIKRNNLMRDVMRGIAHGRIATVDLRVTDDQGMLPIVVALEDDLLDSLLSELDRHDGYANVFVGMNDGRLFGGSFLPSSSAMDDSDATDFGPNPIHPESSVGMFLIWAIQHPVGIKITIPALSSGTEVQDVREMLQAR